MIPPSTAPTISCRRHRRRAVRAGDRAGLGAPALELAGGEAVGLVGELGGAVRRGGRALGVGGDERARLLEADLGLGGAGPGRLADAVTTGRDVVDGPVDVALRRRDRRSPRPGGGARSRCRRPRPGRRSRPRPGWRRRHAGGRRAGRAGGPRRRGAPRRARPRPRAARRRGPRRRGAPARPGGSCGAWARPDDGAAGCLDIAAPRHRAPSARRAGGIVEARGQPFDAPRRAGWRGPSPPASGAARRRRRHGLVATTSAPRVASAAAASIALAASSRLPLTDAVADGA